MFIPKDYDCSDFEWEVIQPLLPNKPLGVARTDDKRVLNGIFWCLRRGAPWADIPSRYGGRSCGGLTTKIHVLVDALGNLITFKITEGQAHDGHSADDLLTSVRRGSNL